MIGSFTYIQLTNSIHSLLFCLLNQKTVPANDTTCNENIEKQKAFDNAVAVLKKKKIEKFQHSPLMITQTNSIM